MPAVICPGLDAAFNAILTLMDASLLYDKEGEDFPGNNEDITFFRIQRTDAIPGISVSGR